MAEIEQWDRRDERALERLDRWLHRLEIADVDLGAAADQHAHAGDIGAAMHED